MLATACVTLPAGVLAGIALQRSGLLSAVWITLAGQPKALPLAEPMVWRDPFVLIAVGQSNSANHGQSLGLLHSAAVDVFSLDRDAGSAGQAAIQPFHAVKAADRIQSP